MEAYQQNVVLTFDPDEYIPVICAVGHNLKEKNLYKCTSTLLLNSTDYRIVHKKCEKFDVFLTYFKNNLIRGFLYTDFGEFNVLMISTFASLQIENFCYDNIAVIKLTDNPFNST